MSHTCDSGPVSTHKPLRPQPPVAHEDAAAEAQTGPSIIFFGFVGLEMSSTGLQGTKKYAFAGSGAPVSF